MRSIQPPQARASLLQVHATRRAAMGTSGADFDCGGCPLHETLQRACNEPTLHAAATEVRWQSSGRSAARRASDERSRPEYLRPIAAAFVSSKPLARAYGGSVRTLALSRRRTGAQLRPGRTDERSARQSEPAIPAHRAVALRRCGLSGAASAVDTIARHHQTLDIVAAHARRPRPVGSMRARRTEEQRQARQGPVEASDVRSLLTYQWPATDR
jgi:hypothetical protein